MSIATVVTMGFSVSGGLQAGTNTIPTLGFVSRGPRIFCISKQKTFSGFSIESTYSGSGLQKTEGGPVRVQKTVCE